MRSPVDSKSIYTGADIKLDAFDCFHNVLNQCVCDYTFSIADAALILKQLTPDIIKKIVPMISQIHSPRKKRLSDNTEYFEESAIDLEVSEITNEKKDKCKEHNKTKLRLKRPDASRPTRMLSPGSNSCSPVSAAVQALISISVPVVEATNTQTNVEAGSKSAVTSSVTVSYSNSQKIKKNTTNEASSVFRPVSKAYANSEFTDSLFTPVPKSSISNNTLTKEPNTTVSTSLETEIPEVFSVSKMEYGEPQSYMISSSSYLDSISTHSSMVPDMSTITTHFNQGVMSTNAIQLASEQILQAKQAGFIQQPVGKSISNDPLPNFNLFSSTGLITDLSCGIPSLFQNPGSPMSSSVAPSFLQQMHPHLQQQLLQKTQREEHSKHQQMDVQQPNFTTSVALAALKNVMSKTETASYQTFQVTPSEQTQTLTNPQTTLAQLRTILPKPYSESSTGSLSIVPVIPPSVVSTHNVSQLSPVIKTDDRKSVQYSVSPSQIFTKLNTSQFSNISLAPINLIVQARPDLSSACFFPHQNTNNLLQNQYNDKDLKQFLVSGSSNVPLYNLEELKQKQETQLTTIVSNETSGNILEKSLKKPENARGQLEVASALLSMRTKTGDTSTTSVDDFKTLQDCIQKSLHNELGNVPILLGDNGTFKIDDVEIDPRKHTLKQDHFECGNCNHVFTSVLYLARHIKRVCPDMSQRKWKCDRCSKAFRHPFGLQQHMFTHTGERPHKCDQCAKAFYSTNDLRRHARTHSGEKPYQCTHCEKRFSTTISLRTHTYIHTGERPHKCPDCSKTFATSSKLSRHVVTHSDKRPFPCDQCSKTFNRSGDLRRHYSNHHGKTHELLACDQCNKGFATEKALVNHRLSHSQDQTSNEQWL